MRVTILEGFAGAGGLSEGARMIGLAPTLGYEINADACRTARAAGHTRVQADVRALYPARLAEAQSTVTGHPSPQ